MLGLRAVDNVVAHRLAGPGHHREAPPSVIERVTVEVVGVVPGGEACSLPAAVSGPGRIPVEKSAEIVEEVLQLQLVPGILCGRQGSGVGCGLGAAAGDVGLAERKVHERKEEQADHRCDVQRRGLPCV